MFELRSFLNYFLFFFKIVYRHRALSCVAKTPVELFFLGLLCIFTSRVCVHVQEVGVWVGGWGIRRGNLHNQARNQRFLQSHQRYMTTRCKVQNKCPHTQRNADVHAHTHTHRSTGNKWTVSLNESNVCFCSADYGGHVCGVRISRSVECFLRAKLASELHLPYLDKPRYTLYQHLSTTFNCDWTVTNI